MLAVFNRELRAYFQTPLGYVLVSALFFFSGYYFFSYNIYGSTASMDRLFELLFPVVLFLVPVLTMRLLSEEKRSGTDQLLLTAPISPMDIVLGKYGAASVVFFIAVSATVLQAGVMSFFASPHWPTILGNFVGLVLLGMALVAICMFLSALTESQVIAAVSGFVVSLFLMVVDALALAIGTRWLQTFFRYLSFRRHYIPFTLGLLELPGPVFFLSVSVLFLLLTVFRLNRDRGW